MTSERIQQLRSMHYIELRRIAASFCFSFTTLPNPVLTKQTAIFLYTAFA